jgi:hypothetical protein
MGGVSRAVTAVAQPIGQAVGVDKKPSPPPPPPAPAPAAQVVQKMVDQVKPGLTQASQAQEQAGSRMRGARRRGRSLLSDARLNAEAGIETLGGGNNLG